MFEHLLWLKVSAHLSWWQWETLRKEENQPVYRHELQQLAAQILEDKPIPGNLPSLPKGAALPIEALYQQVIDSYSRKNLFFCSPYSRFGRSLVFKFSFDNCYIYGAKSEALFIQPLSVRDPQKVSHVFTVAITKAKENNELLQQLIRDSNIVPWLSTLDTREFDLGDGIRGATCLIVADWMALVIELDSERPSSKSPEAHTRWACDITRRYLIAEWFADPFRTHRFTRTIADFPNSALRSIPLHNRRYCWMHGITNMLNNLVKDLYKNVLRARSSKKADFRELMEQVFPNCLPKSNLMPCHAKAFIRDRHYLGFAQLFLGLEDTQISWPGRQPVLMKTSDAVSMVFDAIRAYHDFGYTQWPSQQAFAAIQEARTAVLAFYAALNLRLKPTTHYMTSHAIDLAIADGTAYWTLQEAIEHQNGVNKYDSKLTMKSTPVGDDGQTGWHQLLKRQQLRRDLIEKGHGTPEPDVNPQQASIQSDITRVRFIPAQFVRQ